MLVGALAAMYRRDTQTSRRYLAAIPPGSAPARLVPVIEEIHGEGKPGTALTAAGEEVLSKARGNTDVLKQAAQELDEAFGQGLDDHSPAQHPAPCFRVPPHCAVPSRKAHTIRLHSRQHRRDRHDSSDCNHWRIPAGGCRVPQHVGPRPGTGRPSPEPLVWLGTTSAKRPSKRAGSPPKARK